MAEIIAAFDAARRSDAVEHDVLQNMLPLMPEAPCNGYWHGRSGMDWLEPALA